MYKAYLGEGLCWHYRFQLSLVYQTISQISFKLFCSGDKRLLSSFLPKLGWFQGNTWFCRWKSWWNNINGFLSLKNRCIFLLAKEKIWKRTFKINSELSQNRTEKEIMPFKTTVNWFFNDMWCYLVIVFLLKNWLFSTNSSKGLLYF